MNAKPVTFRLTVDAENTAETFWDSLRASDIPTPGGFEQVEDAIDRDGFAFVDEPTMKAIEALDGWDDGPDYAPTALSVERIESEDAVRPMREMSDECKARLEEALRAAGATQTWGFSPFEAWQFLTAAEADLCAKEQNGEDYGRARSTIMTGLRALTR